MRSHSTTRLTVNQSSPGAPGRSTYYIDGKKVEELTDLPPAPRPSTRREYALDPTKLAGPKLKVRRAETHLAELQRLNGQLGAKGMVRGGTMLDQASNEVVFSLALIEPLPSELSVIIGDVIHNLRAALDHLVSDLVRANNRQPHGGNGFPMTQRQRNLKPGEISKLAGVSAKAERLVLRLRPYEGGNRDLWNLHMLDVLDKHAGIIPVAAATLHLQTTIFAPMGLSVGPNGKMAMGVTPPGFRPLAHTGISASSKQVLLSEAETEIYRAPVGLNASPQGALAITFGRDQVCEGRPVLEVLQQQIETVKRIISIFERRCI